MLYVCLAVPALAQAPPTTASAPPQITAPTPPPDTPPPRVSVPVPAIQRFEGRKVSEITIRGADSAHQQRLRDLLAQKENEKLERSKVRRSIQALYATGQFSDIQVQAEPMPDDTVSLVFVAAANYFFGPVVVYGAPRRAPRESQLVNASKLELGELYTPEKIERAKERMLRVLEDNGYYKASVAEKLTFNDVQQLVTVEFFVQPGEPARVGEVTIEGTPGITKEQVLHTAMLYPGDIVAAEEISKALERLRQKYQEQERLEAQVSLVNRTYHPETNTLDYTFKIIRGPTVDIHVEGAELSGRTLRRYVPVYEENAVDEDLLNEGRRNIRDYFQREGYFDAQVEVEQEYDLDTDHRHIIYRAELGEQHKLEEIVIKGNALFPEETILERLTIREAGWLLSRGLFSQSLLDRDVNAIKTLYRNNGFAQVQVRSEVQDNVGGVHGRMRVLLEITEGPQTRVARLNMLGNQAFTDEQLLDGLAASGTGLNISEGQAYSDANVATDRDTILNFYFNRGFPEATLVPKVEPDPEDSTRVAVTYDINEGTRVFVDQVLVSGLHYTRPSLVQREIKIEESGALSQTDMLETQRRLYDLGIFNEVNVAVRNPDGRAQHKDVLLNVDEARRWTLNYGLGFEYQSGGAARREITQGQTLQAVPPSGLSPRLSFDVTRINFRGRDHTVVFKSRFGRLQQRVLLSYEAPRWFGNQDLRMTFTTFYDTSRDVNTFTARRLEGTVQAEHVLTRTLTNVPITTMLYRFSYRRVKTEDVVVSEADIPLLTRPVRIGMPSLTFIRDLRDDPINSTRGNWTSVDFGYASNLFGSALRGEGEPETPEGEEQARRISSRGFGRVLAQNATYHPLGRRGRYVFARITRIGVAQPVGNTVIPLPERFFVGGANSHRGFAINQAGPRDLTTGFVLGGYAMFVNSLELRTPAVPLPWIGDNLSFVLFHDMGNAYTRAEQIFTRFFRFNQESLGCDAQEPPQCDFGYNSHAVGTGLRYRTPIGPVRLDLGYNLNPTRYLQRDPVSNTLSVQRTGRFNFYFSIGQTF